MEFLFLSRRMLLLKRRNTAQVKLMITNNIKLMFLLTQHKQYFYLNRMFQLTIKIVPFLQAVIFFLNLETWSLKSNETYWYIISCCVYTKCFLRRQIEKFFYEFHCNCVKLKNHIFQFHSRQQQQMCLEINICLHVGAQY